MARFLVSCITMLVVPPWVKHKGVHVKDLIYFTDMLTLFPKLLCHIKTPQFIRTSCSQRSLPIVTLFTKVSVQTFKVITTVFKYLLSAIKINCKFYSPIFWQDPCPLCDEAKEMLEPYKHRVRYQHCCITPVSHLSPFLQLSTIQHYFQIVCCFC